MENSKGNKGIIFLLIVLIILVVFLIWLVIYKGFFVDARNDVIDDAVTTSKVSEKEDDEKYLLVDKYDYSLNGNIKNVYFKYYIENGNDEDYEDVEEAKTNGEYVYNIVNVDIYLENKFVKTIPIFYDLNNNSNETNSYCGCLTKNNIKEFNSLDNKNYLILEVEEAHQYLDGRTNPIIIDESGNVIYEFDYEFNCGLKVLDESSKLYGLEYNKNYLINEKEIYYLTSYGFDDDNDDVYVQENKLVIKNNKAVIEKNNVYIGENAGQC